MNAERRKNLEAIVTKIEWLKDRLESIQSEEQDAYDNMPEGLQNSEKGETASYGLDKLADAVGGLKTVIDDINEVKGE